MELSVTRVIYATTDSPLAGVQPIPKSPLWKSCLHCTRCSGDVLCGLRSTVPGREHRIGKKSRLEGLSAGTRRRTSEAVHCPCNPPRLELCGAPVCSPMTRRGTGIAVWSTSIRHITANSQTVCLKRAMRQHCRHQHLRLHFGKAGLHRHHVQANFEELGVRGSERCVLCGGFIVAVRYVCKRATDFAG